VYLTPAAEKLLMDMRDAEDEMNGRVLRGISAKQRSDLIELLTKIKHNLADVAAAEALLKEDDE
jgi:DNA-binding MarR family transcriptional regulator